ncbi:MAG TPA: hypothetical protein VH135_06730 [Steroidobacteraceae bacterium]|nr:hypothetical protein [Steroidobacteraceae bacterium]
MQARILAALLCGCAVAGSTLADTVVVNDKLQVRESQTAVPKRGLSMGDVEKQFGAPVTKHPTVGGASAQQPPITRWDYNGFAVIFERDRVVDSVVTGGEPAPASEPAASASPTPSA